MNKKPPLSIQERRMIAAQAEVDPRTVDRVLAGERTRPMVKARIVRAMNAAKR